MCTSLLRCELSDNRINAHAFGFGTEVGDKAVASSMLGVTRAMCVESRV